jgi:hypothetical protein
LSQSALPGRQFAGELLRIDLDHLPVQEIAAASADDRARNRTQEPSKPGNVRVQASLGRGWDRLAPHIHQDLSGAHDLAVSQQGPGKHRVPPSTTGWSPTRAMNAPKTRSVTSADGAPERSRRPWIRQAPTPGHDPTQERLSASIRVEATKRFCGDFLPVGRTRGRRRPPGGSPGPETGRRRHSFS